MVEVEAGPEEAEPAGVTEVRLPMGVPEVLVLPREKILLRVVEGALERQAQFMVVLILQMHPAVYF